MFSFRCKQLGIGMKLIHQDSPCGSVGLSGPERARALADWEITFWEFTFTLLT